MKKFVKSLLVSLLIIPSITHAYTLNELIFGAGGNFIKSSSTPYISNLFTGNASTTNLSVSGTASTTNFFGANLIPCLPSGTTFLNWSSGKFTCQSTLFPSPTAGGVNTNVQFNNMFAFGGDSDFRFVTTTDVLHIKNINASSTVTINASTTNLSIDNISGALVATNGAVSATNLSTDQILVGTGSNTFTAATANTANGWVKLDANGNITGYKIIPTMSSTSDIATRVLDEGELAWATGTTPTLRVGESTVGGGYAGGFIINPWDYASSTGNINYSRGNVGIGSSTPTKKLSVSGDTTIDRAGNTGAAFTRTLSIGGSSRAGTVPFVNLDFTNYDNNDGSQDYIAARISLINENGADDGSLRFFTASTADTLNTTPSLSLAGITNPGNVGIGSSTPTSKLSVSGGGYISSNLFVGGNITSTSSNASRFPYASTTMISATTASTTNMIVSSAGGSAGCATFSATGVISNTGSACGTGSGGTFPFTPTSYNGQSVNSTSTGLRLTGSPLSLIASSTLINYASSTALSVSGSTYLATDGVGNVGIGSTSPTKKLVVSGDTTLDRSGSTGANDTRTFEIAGTGRGVANVFSKIDFVGYDNNGTGVDYVGARISSTNANGGDDGDLRFFTSSGALTLNTLPSLVIGGINNAGKVGIGTTSPYASLSVVGESGVVAGKYTATSSSASIIPYASTTSFTSTGSAYLGTNGSYLGFGTAAPTNPFSFIYNDNNFASGMILRNSNAGSFAINGMQFQASDSSAKANFAYFSSGYADPTVADKMVFYTPNTTTGLAFVTNLPASSGNTGDIRFAINNPGSSLNGITVRGSDGSGNVGVGTTSPYKIFSVQGLGSATTTIVHGGKSNPSCDQYFSPNGTAYRTYMSNAGVLTTEAGFCQ